MRVLVANRGEIARRVMRSCRLLGFESVAVYADPDANAPFVRDADHRFRLGPASLAESYLSVERIVEAIKATGATAVHPGYGFLSENASFAEAVTGSGAIWVGPNAECIAQMGSKVAARALAQSAGVPIIPGYDGSQATDDLAKAAEDIGYPVLIKAAAGGGGKGIRIVHSTDEFAAALTEAKSEASRSFGDDTMIVERYIQNARHIEVQVLGDKHGNAIHLGTRECSVQRRYQKLLEEAPAPRLLPETESGVLQAAVSLARDIGYDSAGTVEFVVDDDTGEFFFLEMNTRLQVEHPVTELVTGHDLVALQLAVAQSQVLPLTQDDVHVTGHAIEVRVNAEDASNEWAPQTGLITQLQVPQNVRFDTGVEAGSEITPFYDSMIAKLIVHGGDRAEALGAMQSALQQTFVAGLTTNVGFHRWLLRQPQVQTAQVTTRFLDETPFRVEEEQLHAAHQAAAQAWRDKQTNGTLGPWKSLGSFRVVQHDDTTPVILKTTDGSVLEIDNYQAAEQAAISIDIALRSVAVNLGDVATSFTVLSRIEHWAGDDGAGHVDDATAIVAPFPAVVTEVNVAAGDEVGAGDVIVVIEAMKMLHSLAAKGATTIEAIHVAPGDTVAGGDRLISFKE